MRNIALILMYNGTAYHGWQVQKTEVTVAQTLEKGLSMVCGEPVSVAGCGRTDAGVHAEHYVANFRTSPRASPSTACPLPSTPTSRRTSLCARRYEVADDFNAIGSCIRTRSTPTGSIIPASRTRSMSTGHTSIPKRLDEDGDGPAPPAPLREHTTLPPCAASVRTCADHRPHDLLLPRHAQRRAAGVKGMRERISV